MKIRIIEGEHAGKVKQDAYKYLKEQYKKKLLGEGAKNDSSIRKGIN